jgi:pimeloyl-ACP methyl ester carboxylesterase
MRHDPRNDHRRSALSASPGSGGSEPTTETVASAEGTPIAYRRSGNGPPLVLVHGTAADHGRWAPVLPVLERYFTILAVDRRGRGGSGDAPVYAVEREFEDVAAVVDRAGAGTRVLGHSYGAMCALEAARLTDNLSGLVLYEPPLGKVAPTVEVVGRLEALLEAGERDELLVVFMAEVAGVSPEQIELMRSLPAWQGRLAVAHTIPRELRAERAYSFDASRFRDVRIPTLLLTGEASPRPFAEAAELVRGALPDCRVVVMPGQGHVAMDTGTELFTAEVLRFLGVDAARPPS